MRSPNKILTAVFSSLEDVDGGAAVKIFMLQRSDCPPLLIGSLGPVTTQHVIHPFLSLILCAETQFPSMLYLSPPSFFPSLSSIPSLFLLSHTRRTYKKTLITTQLNLYGNSKPLILWEEGGWNAFCHQTSKLQHVKPRLIACSVQHWDHSSAMCVNLIVRGTLL